jgi:hypothetical protein
LNKAGVFYAFEDFSYTEAAGTATLSVGANVVGGVDIVMGGANAVGAGIVMSGTVINEIISTVAELNVQGYRQPASVECIGFTLANSGGVYGKWAFGGNATIGYAHLTSSVPNQTLALAEGANGPQGTIALVGGAKVVANSNIVAESRILLTSQSDGGVPGFLRVTNIDPGVGFTITSSNVADTSTVFYLILQHS